MKRMLSVTTTVLACLSTTLLPLPGASLVSTAQAGEVCEFTTNSAVTGGAIQQQIDAIAHCNSKKPSTQRNLQPSPQNDEPHSTTPPKESCDSAFNGTAVTGGGIRQQLDQLARCHDQQVPQAMTHLNPSFKLESLGQSYTQPHTPTPSDLNQAACPSLPQMTMADDLQYRVALERCKYGA